MRSAPDGADRTCSSGGGGGIDAARGSADGLFLLQLAGMSGMGKSALARVLGAATGAAVVDLDVLKSASLDAGASWELSSGVGYEAQRAVAEDLLRQGFSAVLDSPCRFERIIAEGMAIAARRGAAYGFIECHLADEQELRRRLRARRALRSQGPDLGVPPPDAPPDSYAGWTDEAGRFRIPPSCYPPPPTPWVRVDTSLPPDACLAAALDYLWALLGDARRT